jgi:hypothetical protein
MTAAQLGLHYAATNRRLASDVERRASSASVRRLQSIALPSDEQPAVQSEAEAAVAVPEAGAEEDGESATQHQLERAQAEGEELSAHLRAASAAAGPAPAASARSTGTVCASSALWTAFLGAVTCSSPSQTDATGFGSATCIRGLRLPAVGLMLVGLATWYLALLVLLRSVLPFLGGVLETRSAKGVASLSCGASVEPAGAGFTTTTTTTFHITAVPACRTASCSVCARDAKIGGSDAGTSAAGRTAPMPVPALAAAMVFVARASGAARVAVPEQAATASQRCIV